MLKTISFFGVCLARSEKTLVSAPISRAYKVKKLRASFPDGVNNLMGLEVFLGADSDAPESGKPGGASVLADYGQVSYVTGNDEQVVMEHEVEVEGGNSFVKVYANNTDYHDHSVNVQVTIDTVTGRE